MSEAARRDDRIPQERTARDLGGLFYGVYPALVVETQDPDHLGRVKLRFPWLAAEDGPEVWARLATLSAHDQSGSWFPPRVDSEVLVAFEAGDVGRPYVIGMLWNGQERPPSTQIKERQETQILSTPRGTRVVFDETAGASSLRLETSGGQRFVLSDQPEALLIEQSDGTKLTLTDGGLEIESAGTVKVSATKIELQASSAEIDSAILSVSGIVKCSVLQTETVIATTYTPGAGNIW